MEANKSPSFVSAVVYVRNAAGHIEAFLNMLHDTLHSRFAHFELICVDDGSADESVSVIKHCADALSDCAVSVVRLAGYQGLETAMNAGVDLAIGDFIYEFDRSLADYPPDLILQVYERALQGYDIVAAGNRRPRASSRLFYRLLNKNASVQYKLTTDTFRILSRRALNRVRSMSRTTPYRKILYANCGLNTDLLYYESSGRQLSYEKQEAAGRRNTGIDTVIIFTDLAYKIALFMTVLMMLATLAAVVYTLVVFLTGSPVPGYTTIMLVVSGCFFMLFAILSVVIRYLSVLVQLVFRQNRYVVLSVDKM